MIPLSKPKNFHAACKCLLAAACLSLILATPSHSQETAEQQAARSESKVIIEKLEQIVQLRSGIRKTMELKSELGTTSQNELFKVGIKEQRALLKLAQAKGDRNQTEESLRRIVALRSNMVRFYEDKYKTGRSGLDEINQQRIKHLNAEIDLLNFEKSDR